MSSHSFLIHVLGLVLIAPTIPDTDFCMHNNCTVGNNNNNSSCNVKRYEHCKKMHSSIWVKWFHDVYNPLYDFKITYINCIDYSDGIVFL